MAKCFVCRTELGGGGIVAEDGRLLCLTCDTREHGPLKKLEPKNDLENTVNTNAFNWENFRDAHFATIQNTYMPILQEYYRTTKDKNFFLIIQSFITLGYHYNNQPDNAYVRLLSIYLDILEYTQEWDQGALISSLRLRDPEIEEDLRGLVLYRKIAMHIKDHDAPTSEGAKKLKACYSKFEQFRLQVLSRQNHERAR